MLSRHRKRRGDKFVNENITLMYRKVNICKKKKITFIYKKIIRKIYFMILLYLLFIFYYYYIFLILFLFFNYINSIYNIST